MLHFLGLGAQKCGSTWLCENLSLHPGVSFPAGKEVHFWNDRKGRVLEAYEKFFDVPDGRLHGDITPAYATLPPPVIAECRRAFPDLRLIYIIRNPMDRAVSHAKMDAVIAGLHQAELPDHWFAEHFRSAASLQRGEYEACIRNWTAFYPEDRLLLLLFDELEADPAGLLGRCCRHLGLGGILRDGGPPLTEQINPGPPRGIPDGLQDVLHELYDGRISSLSRFLGRDLSPWLAGPVATAAGGSG